VNELGSGESVQEDSSPEDRLHSAFGFSVGALSGIWAKGERLFRGRTAEPSPSPDGTPHSSGDENAPDMQARPRLDSNAPVTDTETARLQRYFSAENESVMMEETPLHIYVRWHSMGIHSFSFSPTTYVYGIKECVGVRLSMMPSDIGLFFRDTELLDHWRIRQCGLQDGDTIKMAWAPAKPTGSQ
jgi:hypothetical protein